MEACRAELTVTPDIVTAGFVAEADGVVVGLYRIAPKGDGEADVALFFVDPPFIGKGVGRAMFDHMTAEARRAGYRRLVIEADPGAVPFYRRMGARAAGRAPSGSIPGRMLPRLVYDLTRPDDHMPSTGCGR